MPLEKLITSKLPHKIVAELTGKTPYLIKNIREQFVPKGEFIPNTFVQKRSLERNCIHRFTLFLADRFFNLQLRFGLSSNHAFIKAINIVGCAPTFIANKSDGFHLGVNLFIGSVLKANSQQHNSPTLSKRIISLIAFWIILETEPKLPYPPSDK